MKKMIETFTLKDALDLAIQIELHAKERYEEFSRQIGSVERGDAGDFFSVMSQNESKHAEDLINKYIHHFGKLKPEIFIEDYYEYLEIEAPEYDRAESFMSVRSALEVAKDSEIKAHRFYQKLSQISLDTDVKEFFIQLMNEEDLHRRLVEEQILKIADGKEPLRNKDDIDEPNGL